MAGRLPDGRYRVDGQTYEIKQHGFARDLPWTVVDESSGDEASVTVGLEASDATRAVYPFDFALRFTYRLRGGMLSVEQTFENRGRAPMPIQPGLHPYFFVPDASKADARVETDATRAYDNRTGREVAVPRPIPLAGREVDLFLLDHGPRETTLSRPGRASVRLAFGDEQRVLVADAAGARLRVRRAMVDEGRRDRGWDGAANRGRRSGDDDTLYIVVIDGLTFRSRRGRRSPADRAHPIDEGEAGPTRLYPERSRARESSLPGRRMIRCPVDESMERERRLAGCDGYGFSPHGRLLVRKRWGQCRSERGQPRLELGRSRLELGRYGIELGRYRSGPGLGRPRLEQRASSRHAAGEGGHTHGPRRLRYGVGAHECSSDPIPYRRPSGHR